MSTHDNAMAADRSKLQFTLKTLMLVVAVSVLASWLYWRAWPWYQHRRLISELQQSVLDLQQLGTDGYFEVASRYRALFEAVTPAELSALTQSEHPTIAMQAAWQEARMTVPEEGGHGVLRPDPEKLASFLECVQARCGSPVPPWWAESALSARANRRDNIYGGEPSERPYHNAGLAFVTAPLGTTVEQEGERCTLHVGEDSLVLPVELLNFSNSGALSDNVSAAFTPAECFVALHGDVGYPHVVACVDRATGKIKWKSAACGCWWGGASGHHVGWVTVVVAEDRVNVFGKASIGFYAQGFSRENGDTLFFYSSSY